jgi:hypothetical protein
LDHRDRAGEMDLEVTADAECERKMDGVSGALPTICKGEKDVPRRLPEAIAPRFINQSGRPRTKKNQPNTLARILCADDDI